MAKTTFQQYGPARWRVPGADELVFPVERIHQVYENRIVDHERYGQDGARLDDTGSKADIFEFTVGFYNSDKHEIGVDGTQQYPTVLNALAAACKIHETGNLYVPTVGWRRCRAWKYDRVEEASLVDFAAFIVSFKQDNEDDESTAAESLPSAAAVIRRQARDAVELLKFDTAGTASLSSLQEFAAGLEALANAPNDYASDIEAQVNGLSRVARRVDETFSQRTNEAVEEVNTLLTDPTSSRAARLLQQLQDTAARLSVDKFGGSGRTLWRTFQVDLSIFDIGTRVNQNPVLLINLNTQLEDLLDIRAGTRVRVFDRAVA